MTTSPARPRRLVIFARNAPVSAGGLASYQRFLAQEFELRTGIRASLYAFHGGGDVPGIDSMVHEPRRLWMNLASQRLLHPLLTRWIASTCRGALDALFADRPDVVHFVGTGWDMTGFALADCARRYGARFTVWPAVHPDQWGDDHLDVALYRRADAVFCQSRHEIHHLAARGVEHRRMVLCGLPPICPARGDGDGFRATHALASRPVALFVGRRDDGKGFPALLAAWRIVLDRHPTAVLIIAGPGGERLSDPSLIDLGVATQAQLADAYAACDVFCMPSAHESFGIAFVDAWSYGKPVICGPAPAPREWIAHGVTGLHSSQDPADIAAALIRLINDPASARAMGEAGKLFQKTHLTKDTTLGTHLSAFGFVSGEA